MPAVREKSVDQAKPMITSESDRIGEQADQPDRPAAGAAAASADR